jgi:hypothetical protein
MAGPFTVQQSLHGQPSVTTLNAPVPLLEFVRNAVMRNHMDDPVYHLRTRAQAFLQGYDEGSGWLLVEFWTGDPERYGPFVDWLNANAPSE